MPSSNVVINWQSVAGANYFVQRSLNPDAPISFVASNMVVVATNIIGQSATTSFADTNTIRAGPFFYRVGVQQQ